MKLCMISSLKCELSAFTPLTWWKCCILYHMSHFFENSIMHHGISVSVVIMTSSALSSLCCVVQCSTQGSEQTDCFVNERFCLFIPARSASRHAPRAAVIDSLCDANVVCVNFNCIDPLLHPFKQAMLVTYPRL